MKADKFGTACEQARWSNDWITASEANRRRIAETMRCEHCLYLAWTDGGGKRCAHIGCATVMRASCAKFQRDEIV